jgi:diguanylate cyclase (GGDEF)-like protein
VRTPLNDAGELAERLRERIGSERFAVPQKVTISLGVAEYLQGENTDALFERADKALYQAKEAGRNRVRKAA